MADPFILCDNLVKIFQLQEMEVVALQGLDMIVEEGELMSIIGTSGSGKSTLLNVLGGLIRPSAGRVVVGGQELLKLSDTQLDRYRREMVGFVWQQSGRNLIPYLTAKQNVELPMTIAGIAGKEKRKWAQELLEGVDLWQERNNRLQQLSGGQQQRVAIAVALANKPRLLLGDEPTGELDSATATSVLALLRHINEQYNITTILVTHDPATADSVDRTITIRDGRTSVETVRQEQTEADAAKIAQEMLVVDSAGRLQLPDLVREEAEIGSRVTVEQTEHGILIRPVEGRNGQSAVAPIENDEPPEQEAKGLRRIFRRKKA